MTGSTLRLTILLLSALASPLTAQQRMAVLHEAGSPVMATEFLIAVGPINEPEGQEGITYLAARSVAAPIRAAMDSLGAQLVIRPEKDAISFSMISAPDAWHEVTERVARALLRDEPESGAVILERAAIARELRGRAANPADAATRSIERAFFGLGHPWGRSTVGTPESIETIAYDDVAEFLRDNFTPDRIVVATVGPIDRPAVVDHLRPLVGSSFPAPVEMDDFDPAERPVVDEYNSITTWVSASFPFAESADFNAVGMVAFLAADALSFSLTQSSVYNVSSEVTRRIGGGEVRLQIVVPPEESEEWAERIAGIAGEIQGRTLPPDVFRDYVRKYRGKRLMAMASPEDRAHFAARSLLTAGEFAGLDASLDDMTQDRIRSAARSLGPPSISVLGPDIDP